MTSYDMRMSDWSSDLCSADLHSAMFDPYAYEDPDRFNPNRIFDHNFNFGFVQHQCLGKYVGMEMIPEMVRQVLLLGDLRSDGPISYRNDCFPDQIGRASCRERVWQ